MGFGVLALLACAVPAAAVPVSFTFPDPVGDTYGVGPVQHDLVSTTVTFTATDIAFTVFFDGPISAPLDLAADSGVGSEVRANCLPRAAWSPRSRKRISWS
jgi:hypothetical protein